MDIVNINIVDQTTPIAQRDLSTILVVATDKAIPYQEASSIDAFTGILPTDPAYTVLENIFKQEAQIVALVGGVYTLAGDMTALLNTLDTDKFFHVVTDTTTADIVDEINNWAGSHEKFFFFTPKIADGITIVDDSAAIAAAQVIADGWNSAFSWVGCHKGTLDTIPEQYDLASGYIGALAPISIGSTTSAFKQVNGCPKNYYAPAAQSAVEAEGNMNWIQNTVGVNIVMEGKTTAGTYLDIEMSKIWLKYKLEESLSSLLIRTSNKGKIPFTLDGRAQIDQALREVCSQAATQGIIVPESVVIYVPTPAELMAVDRASRIWKNIKITATVQGAVHVIEITFVLNV